MTFSHFIPKAYLRVLEFIHIAANIYSENKSKEKKIVTGDFSPALQFPNNHQKYFKLLKDFKYNFL